LDSGSINIEPHEVDRGQVNYLIFEKADANDVRSHLKYGARDNTLWKLQALHNIAAALQQLHKERIAHLDVKPSNAVVFDGGLIKLCDLGRSDQQGTTVPHAMGIFPGALAYAPIEVLYRGYRPISWEELRLGSDLYMLGGMAVYFFTNATITSLIAAELAPEHLWDSGIDYPSVLPYLQRAFGQALERMKDDFPESIREDLLQIVQQLCQPDVEKRGHPISLGNKHEPNQSLHRYVGKLSTLIIQARVKERQSGES